MIFEITFRVDHLDHFASLESARAVLTELYGKEDNFATVLEKHDSKGVIPGYIVFKSGDEVPITFNTDCSVATIMYDDLCPEALINAGYWPSWCRNESFRALLLDVHAQGVYAREQVEGLGRFQLNATCAGAVRLISGGDASVHIAAKGPEAFYDAWTLHKRIIGES